MGCGGNDIDASESVIHKEETLNVKMVLQYLMFILFLFCSCTKVIFLKKCVKAWVFLLVLFCFFFDGERES
jgi:hypothetical protein